MQAMMSVDAGLKLVGIHLSHDDDTGARSITLPARSLLLDAFAICTENAGGTTRPIVDFGIQGGDADGIFDGLGAEGFCDVAGDVLEDEVEYLGRGELLVKVNNEEDLKTKATKFSAAATVYMNTLADAGTGTVTGEWDIYLLYVVLPEIE